MSFNLKVTFTGMCMFLPDPGDSTPGATPVTRMHVLMPGTGGHALPPGGGGHPGHPHGGGAAEDGDGHGEHPAGGEHPDHPGNGGGGHGMEPHVVRLLFNTAFLAPGAEDLNDDIAPAIAMDGRTLELPDFGSGAGPVLSLSGRELFNLDDVVGDQVPRRLVEPIQQADAERVAARVTMAAGTVTRHAPGAAWDLDVHTDVPMTYRVEWTIPVAHPDVDDQGREVLRLALAKLDGSPAEPVPDLYPVNGEVRLHVYHTPPRELPPGRPDSTPVTQAHHFDAFYVLYDRQLPPPRPLPRFKKGVPTAPGPVGADPHNCMSTRGTVKP